MKTITSLMFTAAAAAALAMPALSQAAETASPIALNGDVKAVKVVTEADGRERTELVEPTAIVPGDRLVFGTDYANRGGEAVTNFVVTNPLPAPCASRPMPMRRSRFRSTAARPSARWPR